MAQDRFRGWTIAWVASSVLGVAYGVQFAFGVLLPDIEADTGWSRTQVSLAYSLYVLLYSGLSFGSGTVTDRSGPRVVIATGGVFLALGYLGTGLARELWQLYVALGVVAAIGMSAAFVPCNATVVRWFVRHRGRALSISTAGTSVGGLVFPPLAGLLSATVGWRGTYVVFGLVAGAWLLVASRVMVRSPEEVGLHPDGDPAPPPPPDRTDEPEVVVRADLAVAQAVRTAVFWVIAAAFACTWLVLFFPVVHLSPFAEDLGLGRTVGSTLVGAIGVGGLLGRSVSGGVSDRLGRHPTLAAVVALQAAAFVVFALADTATPLYAGAVAFGVGYGGTTTLFPAVIGDHFGRTHAGALVGLVFAGAGSMAALGPAVAGYLYDSTGSYRLAFVLSAAANVASLACVAVLWSHPSASPSVDATAPVADLEAG